MKYIIPVENTAGAKGHKQYIKCLEYLHFEHRISFSLTPFASQAEQYEISTASSLLAYFSDHRPGCFHIERMEPVEIRQ